MTKPLTIQEEAERAKGIKDFCAGKPFNINRSEAWAIGWKETAAKFRVSEKERYCVAISTTMNRQCMRRATFGDLCTWHAKLVAKSETPPAPSNPAISIKELWRRHSEMKEGLYAMVKKRERQGRDAESLRRSVTYAVEQDERNIRAMAAHG